MEEEGGCAGRTRRCESHPHQGGVVGLWKEGQGSRWDACGTGREAVDLVDVGD